MIDSHCHLWFPDFDKDRQETIRRARDAGVHTMIQVGCDEKSSRQSIELAERHEGMYATVGLHPVENDRHPSLLSKSNSSYGTTGKDGLNWIRDLVKSSGKVVAIGETGLDYYHEPFDAEVQKSLFREQCLIAQEFDLPVVVHHRGSKLNPVEKDTLKVLDEAGMKPGKVVFHCFSGDRNMAEEVLKRGWYISFSGVVTYPNAVELREVAKICPMDRILVETDAPFLSPQKNRGARNEPAYVVETAKLIAELKGISLKEFENLTDENAKMLFSLA